MGNVRRWRVALVVCAALVQAAAADPSGFKPLAQAKVLDARPAPDKNKPGVWAPMALVNGRLLVRNQYVLKCLELR